MDRNYEREKKIYKVKYLVDHGSVFILIGDGSLVVEEFSRGLLIAVLKNLFKTRKHHFHKIRPPFHSQT